MTILTPASNDILGDRWAASVRRIFERACEAEGITKDNTEGLGVIWNLFQWQYCQWAEMQGRVIASPQAMAMCGWEITDAMLATADRLLDVQSELLEKEG